MLILAFFIFLGGVTLDSNSTSVMLCNKIHYGRQDIILDYDEVTPDNVMEVMQKALSIHSQNARDCEYLINYFLGKQDILYMQIILKALQIPSFQALQTILKEISL